MGNEHSIEVFAMLFNWLFGKRTQKQKAALTRRIHSRLALENLESRLVPTGGFMGQEVFSVTDPLPTGLAPFSLVRASETKGACISEDHHAHEEHDAFEFTDAKGREIAACPVPTGKKVKAMEAPQMLFNASDTFTLHSRRGASKTVYLDFDGHITQSTNWNSWRQIGSIITPAYNSDGTNGFSNTELAEIQEIWARVVEDFAPFDVDVTTQAPALGDLINSGSGDNRWGIRVAIGGSPEWLGMGAGGIAYIGSFNWDTDTPTYVFSDVLYSPKSVAEATSHEIGHTLGLFHDGRTSPQEGYYAGHGSGQTSWAPIMGVGYYSEVVQWSRGEYANANNSEDDLTIITTNNGFGFRQDDVGNSLNTAYFLGNLSKDTTLFNGIIENGEDADSFSFNASGKIKVTVSQTALGANLDIQAEIYSSSGQLVSSANPADTLGASLELSVAPGTYYLIVRGAGLGDPATNGYSRYASIGQYKVSLVASGSSGSAPSAPTNLQTKDVSSNQVELTWKDTSKNERGFNLFYRTTDGSWMLGGTSGANKTSFTVKGLDEKTSYQFKVVAFNDSGDSAASNIAKATTLSVKIPAPTNLKASGVQKTSFKLAWSSSAANVARFEVWVKVDGSWKRSEDVPGNRKNATIDYEVRGGSRLKAGKTYQVKMRTIDNAGRLSDWSEEITVKMAK
jgi:hypothetical protein